MARLRPRVITSSSPLRCLCRPAQRLSARLRLCPRRNLFHRGLIRGPRQIALFRWQPLQVQVQTIEGKWISDATGPADGSPCRKGEWMAMLCGPTKIPPREKLADSSESAGKGRSLGPRTIANRRAHAQISINSPVCPQIERLDGGAQSFRTLKRRSLSDWTDNLRR